MNDFHKALVWIFVVCCCIIVIVYAAVLHPITDPYEYQFTAVLVDFKPPSFASPAYLIFDNGAIIKFSGQGAVYQLKIGATYDVYKHNQMDTWRVAKVE